jgi:TPP-dependent pyruvate/acetoin dehydrogenase alpha subunit
VTEDELGAMRASLDAEIEAAITQADREPDPTPDTAMRHVYAEDHPIPDGTRA